jgi:hypothetical protein
MGISLNGLTPAGTYPGLIKTGDNTPISGTPKVLSDGNGNNLPMEVSTTGVNLTGSPTVNAVAIANTTQVAAKQDTLVSGTNIKTINGASLLGSGNIPVVTSPSGVSGAIQFSNGSAFASDAANLFWDDTNKRLGIGTNAPSTRLHILSPNDPINGNFTTRGNLFIATSESATINVGGTLALGGYFAGTTNIATFGKVNGKKESSSSGATDGYLSFETLQNAGNALIERMRITSVGNIGIGETAPTSRLQIKGSGSTSATTSLLVQNSAGVNSFKVNDAGFIDITTSSGQGIQFYGIGSFYNNIKTGGDLFNFCVETNGAVSKPTGFNILNTNQFLFDSGANPTILKFKGQTSSFPAIKQSSNNIEIKNADDTFGAGLSVGAALNASAILQASSTTKGFLPPVMTTTQKNAIAFPATGLVVYDNTTNKLCCYNGSTWNDLF